MFRISLHNAQGRSGSTVLDRIIVNGDNAFSMSEIVSGCLREDNMYSFGSHTKEGLFLTKKIVKHLIKSKVE